MCDFLLVFIFISIFFPNSKAADFLLRCDEK